ncbi:hypothetical protein J437_LFUL017153 [Ladona fulva]|uniref:Uncharacterized protein n=1 Tax=Ladona fulva TaxID=123851 RepID=A0A8K0K8C9_LADFU|nr:hypothetical protein J437_LFUL017153 [Ladona fulva]
MRSSSFSQEDLRLYIQMPLCNREQDFLNFRLICLLFPKWPNNIYAFRQPLFLQRDFFLKLVRFAVI